MLKGPGLAILSGWVLVTRAQAQESSNRYINPPSLVKPTGYTHVVVAVRDEGRSGLPSQA